MADRLRLLELTLRYPPVLGGVEATVGQMVDRLRSAGLDVRVATSDLERVVPFTRRPSFGDVDPTVRRYRAVRALPLPLGLGTAVPGMLEAALREPVDVLHAHAFGYFPTWAGAFARRWRRVPLVITPHADPGRGLTFSRPYHRLVAAGTLRRADRVLAQSGAEARFLTGLGVDPERVTILPTGIVVADFAGPSVRPTEGPEVRALCVGRLEMAQKGLDTLLRAVSQLPKSSNVRLRIVGDDWGGRAPLEELARHWGLADRVSVETGLSNAEVVAAYRAADLFVLPSRFESFPRVVLEAMAAGLPIVATRVGSVAEMVVEGKNALLVPRDDPAALATAIAALASDAGVRSRFRQESRRRADAFDWAGLLPRYIATFEEVAAAT